MALCYDIFNKLLFFGFICMQNFLKSRFFQLLLLFVAVAVVLFDAEVTGVIIFLNIIGFVLIACRETAVSFLPFMLTCTFAVKCYDSFSVFAPLWWAYIFPIGAVIFHFIFYRRKFVIGKSFFGLAAVAFAVTFGGVGIISAKEYFAPMSLYYIFGLGIGMLFVYLLLRPAFVDTSDYKSSEAFIFAMYITGIFASFMVIRAFWQNDIAVTGSILPQIQWSNNISTVLMLAMPIPLYFTRKNPLHISAVLLFYICAALSGSRGGLILGGVEFIICIIAFIFFAEKRKEKLLRAGICGGVMLLCAVLVCFNIIPLSEIFPRESVIIAEDEARVMLAKRAAEDFCRAPIFGIGLGNRANTDLYPAAVKGTICWYHTMIPQIIGSMGIIGIIAYGFNIILRFILVIKKKSLQGAVMGLSYLGLLLMSQVNPGEFCPLPYALVAVIIFIFVENRDKEITE